MFFLITTLWVIWEVKFVLFWLYLWQLKDYHLGRFIDHFRTHKGKKIFLNFETVAKLVLLVLFLLDKPQFIYLFSAFSILYLYETALFMRGIFVKSVRKPVKTLKVVFLGALSFSVIAFLLVKALEFNPHTQLALFLVIDLLTPMIISLVVLLFQPIFVVIRNSALKKATKKMEAVKLLSGLKVIAITGSYGKTSTKEFLSTILAKKFKVLKTNNHQNSEIGVAKCILRDLKPSHQIFIAEVGAYNKGKIKEVCAMLKPGIGIVTGVNEQHLALFGSLENLLSAEGGGELANSLPENGLLVINGDNKHCLDLYKRTDNPTNKKIYSLSNNIVDSDIWTEDITVQKDSISFVAVNKKGEMTHFGVKVLGKHNAQNLLGAILIARELGMCFGEISEACKSIFEEQAGMVLKQGKHGITIVDSSYSANPDGVFADLDYFKILGGKRVVVMPCLIELGEKSSMIHEKIGKEIGKVSDLAIITSKDKFKELRGGFIEIAGHPGAKCLLCDNAQDIYSMITLFCKAGDAVLLEGRVPQKLVEMLVSK